MDVTKNDIDIYLSEVKESIRNNRYRIERFGNSDKLVSLYIKFNKLENCYVIVVSLHEQKYPLKYYFK